MVRSFLLRCVSSGGQQTALTLSDTGVALRGGSRPILPQSNLPKRQLDRGEWANAPRGSDADPRGAASDRGRRKSGRFNGGF
jgi:hypothetical protein